MLGGFDFSYKSLELEGSVSSSCSYALYNSYNEYMEYCIAL